jgi:large subunit ribosomal protein L10
MRKEKQLLLDEVKNQIDMGNGFILMRYTGLTPNTANAFRTAIAKTGGNVKVVRKRILVKAAEASGVSFNMKEMQGHISVVFAGPDLLETTKTLMSFSKDNGDIFQVVAGRYEGKVYDRAQMEMLATLPSKDAMRAQLLGTLEAPMAQTLAVLEALLTSVPYCLENKAGHTE